MKVYGLKFEELQLIKSLLQKHFGDTADVKVYLYGSRANGKYKTYSDIDIAIKSKSKNLNQKISLLREEWDNSTLPYKADITLWNELYKPYLPKIRKEKIPFWQPEEKQFHPWRICPYGQHWVIRHQRKRVASKIQDVDGHCRKNPSGKDVLDGDEIDLISKSTQFLNVKEKPKPYQGKEKIKNPDEFDALIAGWCKYWNDIFQPEIPIEPNLVKALMESESSFNRNAKASNKPTIGIARGLIQLTEETVRILKDRKGEIKDHYIDITYDELFEPSKKY